MKQPRLNAIYIQSSKDQIGYVMKAFFINGQITKGFLDSLNMESLWNRAKDLTIPDYSQMVLEGYEIEYQSNVGITAITIVSFNFMVKTYKEKMETIVKNAERIRKTYYGMENYGRKPA